MGGAQIVHDRVRHKVTSIRPGNCMALSLLVATMPLSGVAAQAPPAHSDKDIVVVGQRLKDALRHFVDDVTDIGPTGQIARWDRQICPKVIGVDPAQAEFMTARIAQIAKTVGIRTGRGCPTMLTIVFTPDAAPLAGAVGRDFPTDNWKLRSLLNGFANSTKPVRWISLSNECGGGCELPNSRLVKPTSPTLQAMLIIVDAGKISGTSIGEMSDYLALVALSNPPLGTDPSASSILSLFNRARTRGSASQLTDHDFSFLAGLYGVRLNLDAATQRESIASRMKRDLGRNPPDNPSQTPPQN